MSFLTAQPEELAAAAGKLGVIGSAFAAQNAAAAAPTNVPDSVRSLASPVTAAAAAAPDVSGLVQDTINGAVNTGAWFTTAGITSAIFLNHTLNTLPAAGAAAGAVPGAAAAALANTVMPAGVGGPR